ncbi:hypothetical protein ABBQ32_008778 [Trebouxia sp. C0010 RCD-2024]
MLHITLTHAVAPAVKFFVRCYKRELVSPDATCSNVLLIRADAATSAWHEQCLVVSPSQIVQQVFNTSVPDMVSLGHPWIWVLHYASSSYQAMVREEDEDHGHGQDDAGDTT